MSSPNPYGEGNPFLQDQSETEVSDYPTPKPQQQQQSGSGRAAITITEVTVTTTGAGPGLGLDSPVASPWRGKTRIFAISFIVFLILMILFNIGNAIYKYMTDDGTMLRQAGDPDFFLAAVIIGCVLITLFGALDILLTVLLLKACHPEMATHQAFPKVQCWWCYNIVIAVLEVIAGFLLISELIIGPQRFFQDLVIWLSVIARIVGLVIVCYFKGDLRPYNYYGGVGMYDDWMYGGMAVAPAPYAMGYGMGYPGTTTMMVMPYEYGQYGQVMMISPGGYQHSRQNSVSVQQQQQQPRQPSLPQEERPRQSSLPKEEEPQQHRVSAEEPPPPPYPEEVASLGENVQP